MRFDGLKWDALVTSSSGSRRRLTFRIAANLVTISAFVMSPHLCLIFASNSLVVCGLRRRYLRTVSSFRPSGTLEFESIRAEALTRFLSATTYIGASTLVLFASLAAASPEVSASAGLFFPVPLPLASPPFATSFFWKPRSWLASSDCRRLMSTRLDIFWCKTITYLLALKGEIYC